MLNEQQRNTLQLICETFCPRIEVGTVAVDNLTEEILTNSASQFDAAEHIVRRLSSAPHNEQRQFRVFLTAIEKPILCCVLTGQLKPFSTLDLALREAVLKRWSTSRLPAIRRFFQSIKRITLFLSYASPLNSPASSDRRNPTWNAIGYSGENKLLPKPTDIQLMQIPDGDVLFTEVLVIGSGAGGAVAASNLARSGREVLIAEKGGFFDSTDLGNSELEGNRRLFDKMGSLTSRDLSVVILSGSSLGGGTTVNWMTCLAPPDLVREQWATEFGFHQMLEASFDESLQRVNTRLNVNSLESEHNLQNQLLLDGCEALGYQTAVIPRNCRGCGDCGFCGYGCKSGAKQDTRQTFLQDATQFGSHVLVDCEITSLKTHGNQVVGANAVVGRGENKRRLQIKCKAVVLAGGSIQSAALLLRSGMNNSNIGKHLHLHPTTAIASFFSQPVEAWQGAPQTIVCEQFSNLDGAGYGVRLEVAPMHPGFGAMALAWENAIQHKSWMQRFGNLANIIVLTRDRGAGRVSWAGKQIRVDYRLDGLDARHLMDGVQKAIAIHSAAGAETIVGPHQTPVIHQRGQDISKFCSRVRKLKATGNVISLFSAHQMSTCRIGMSRRQGVFDPSGRSFDHRNLFVADASCLPTSTGVNPMISIMSVADLLSRRWDF